MRRRVAATALALACLLAAAAPATAAPETAPSLPAGWWVGRYLTTNEGGGGTIVVGIARDGTATGSIDAEGLAASVTKRRGTKLTVSGRLKVSGDATNVFAEGKIRARGRIKVMGFTVPVNRKLPALASLQFSSATCALAAGDLSGSAELPAQLSGYDTSVAAKAILRRIDHRPTSADTDRAAQEVAEDFLAAGRALGSMRGGRVTVSELGRAHAALQTLFASADWPASCTPTADTEMHRGFAAAVVRLLTSKGLSETNLEQALRLAVQLGLLSNDFAATDAAGLRSLFEPALRGELDRADGDAAKARIRVAAAQYGFGDLE